MTLKDFLFKHYVYTDEYGMKIYLYENRFLCEDTMVAIYDMFC